MRDQGEDLPPEQWRRVKKLFGAALERAPSDRAAFLNQACGTEEGEVRREVEALLASHEASDTFLKTKAAREAPATPAQGQLGEGRTLGPYRVLRTLGRGGMATVYLANDPRHRRSVALKVLHPELAHALGPERFLREIEVAANLSHPHILPLHDSGEAAGLLYYVMPYIEGESLRDRLGRETQLPVEDALRIATEVADALAYAHGQGVIHRDIKPENILLTGGHALVADFGIAKAVSAAGAAHLTETGMAVGTAAYMSPEQASAASHIDGRSDIYSLGCVLYEMLAGEPPYTGPTAQAIIAKRFTSEVPRVRHVRPSVTAALDEVVTKALAPTPADRWPTAKVFTEALRQALATPIVSTPAPVFTPGTSGPARAIAPRRASRRLLLGVATLVVLLLLGLGVLFTWGRPQRVGSDRDSPRRLAVLPFENLGAPEDEYFADGISDEVRGRLSMLPGLQVIARGSSIPYRKSTLAPERIALELGVGYLLTATVRWEKVPGGPSKVNVSPELVEVRSGGAPSIKWQQPIEASLAGVFQLYADIGSRVAQALDVVLSDSARWQLAEKPTENLAAYDAYLKGEQVAPNLFFGDPLTLQRAVDYYAQAVALDSTFGRAWARLSLAHSSLYPTTPTPARADQALRAAQRARDLAPRRGEGHVALGFYYLAVASDNARAAEEFRKGQLANPSNADLLVGRALAAQRMDLDTALTYLRQAQTLDPRSVTTAEHLAFTLLLLRRYPEARQAADYALALVPSDLFARQYLAMTMLAQGDLAGARAVVAAARKDMESGALLAHFAVYQDLYWVLDEPQQQKLLNLPLSAFGNDRVGWGLALAGTYALHGDHSRARAFADSARIVAEEQLRAAPEDAQLHTLRGLSLAYVGRKTEAIQEGLRGIALVPIAKDAVVRPYLQHQLARIYILLGEAEKALDHLEPLLKIPYYLSPGWLRIDPTFAPLRGNPRFDRLLQGK